MVTVVGISTEHWVKAPVANTLKVEVALRFSTGKLIVPPVPATGSPTGLSSASFCNWQLIPVCEEAMVILELPSTQILGTLATGVRFNGSALMVTITVDVAVHPKPSVTVRVYVPAFTAAADAVTTTYATSPDGVTWTSNTLPAARGQAQGVWDGTYFQQFGGENSSATETATSYYTTGSGWTAGTNIPSAYNALGGAWAVGGTVAINNFFAAGTWYRTGVGAWTVGTSAPNKSGRSGFGSGQTAGPNDRSVAYGYVAPNSSTASDFAVFSQSSANGAWSTFIDSAAYAAQRPNMAWANGFLFTYGGDNNSFVMFTSCYRTTGSSWTVQNSLPVGVGNWAGSGGVGNDIYVWGGANSSGTPRTQTVYKATQN